MRYRRLDVPVQKDGEGSEGIEKNRGDEPWRLMSVWPRPPRKKKIQFPPGFEPGIQDSKSWVLNHYTTGTSARVTEQRLYFREKIRLVRRWIKICCHGGPNQDKRLISAHAGILRRGV